MMRTGRSCVLVLALLPAGCGSDDMARRRSADAATSLPALMRIADAAAGRRAFGRCLACHGIASGGPDRNGPNLHAIMGKPVAGGSPRFGYTAALMRVGGRWDARTMDAWLRSPARFAPGTAMTFADVPDRLERADIIAYLQAEGH